jgi:hypothetical protein
MAGHIHKILVWIDKQNNLQTIWSVLNLEAVAREAVHCISKH